MATDTAKFLLLIMLSFFTSHSSVTSQNNQSLTTVGRTGQWTLLHESIGISAMHMQLLHNNQIVVFDRTDFGPSNLSLPHGRCRYDASDKALKWDCTAHSVLYDIATNAYRPLQVQTDTWCSSGAVLDNGTLVQIGGYNDGDRVVRMFTPCAENSNCDWIEFPGYLSRRRWYATNQILPDGERIIVVGGRRQYNYEFYPNTSTPRYSFLKFLRDTRDGNEENNLYPFLHLLPDGNLFIFANTRSILLDYNQNRVVKEFPAIPGGDPRNYPSSGSSVLLPLDDTSGNAPKADILVCGGAPRGGFAKANRGSFVRASSTCGRLVASDQNPSWEMEEMPTPRVMGDMILLPTGDILIVNGAQLGTAGWESARQPVTTPALYSPYAQPGSRFFVLSPASRPRMYHSSAILLPDGRVLVGGSNPHIYYNFTNVDFPTDLSLEAFSPPYLSTDYSNTRPRIVSYDETISYGEDFSLSFVVEEYLGHNSLSARIVAPSFTTHAFGMNQRMVVLKLRGVDVHGQSGGLRLMGVGPSTDAVAPSGYYMLFVVHNGIPSSGVWVKIQ